MSNCAPERQKVNSVFPSVELGEAESDGMRGKGRAVP